MIKIKKPDEFIIANNELVFQNEEKGKRATEVIVANKRINHLEELLQNDFKEISDYKYALDESSIIAITDQKGIIKKVNSNFCRISKYSEEELIGQDHRIINSGYHPKAFIRDLWLTIANGKIWRGELKNKAKDGTFYWVDTTIVPFLNEHGKPYQYIAIRADITARKETEKDLTQRTAQLKTANKELVFQHEEKEKRAAELGIANIKLVFQNDEKEKKAAELGIANIKLVFQNDEKEKKAAELSIANKELAFQNNEKEKRAAELLIANKELESFTFISSHHLQEPLRKIQAFVKIILEEENKNLSGNGKNIFQRVQLAAVRMRQLLDDLLVLKRITITELKFEKTDLNTIIEEVKAELKDTIEKKHAAIEVSENCSANIIIFQFRQLMFNLLSNALKFSQPDTPPHIIIKCRIVNGSELNNEKLSPELKYCHITITDNGIGFESQHKNRIFEIFQRLHTKEKYAGTGIGLAIVKKIVDNHNGIISATSELTKGTTFDIYIPDN